ncbi:MAG TPA: rhodanese-like domain-containing protein [Woeseiaceae bacterium]|jgi:rhodanese-related sulfurtransferase|nr:rhodanese-like domain-containing protein [Woeseiaceae bacterium]
MIEELTPSEYLGRCRAGELWQLVDVREQWEIETASIENTINIPLRDLPSRLSELDPGRPVAFICHSGGRSARAAVLCAASGHQRVANIRGGIDAWSDTVDPAIPRY